MAVAQERPGQRDSQERPGARRSEATERQEETTRGSQRVGAGQQGHAEQMQSLDAFIAAGLIIDNQEEIELNRAAMDKIQNEQAKQYAQKMIEEHTKVVQQLQQIVPQDVSSELQFTSARAGEPSADGQQQRTEERATSERETKQRESRQRGQRGADQQGADQQGADQQGADQPGAAERRSPGANDDAQEATRREESQTTTRRPGAAQGQDEADVHLTAVVITRGAPMHRMLMIHRAKAENCLAISKQQLEQADASQVDQVYLGQQVAAHVAMLSKLRALEGQTGAELQQLITQGEKATQQHLTMAEQLMKQIGSEGGARPSNNQ